MLPLISQKMFLFLKSIAQILSHILWKFICRLRCTAKGIGCFFPRFRSFSPQFSITNLSFWLLFGFRHNFIPLLFNAKREREIESCHDNTPHPLHFRLPWCRHELFYFAFFVRFELEMRRKNSVTPKNYLDFLANYQNQLKTFRGENQAVALRLSGLSWEFLQGTDLCLKYPVLWVSAVKKFSDSVYLQNGHSHETSTKQCTSLRSNANWCSNRSFNV